MSGGHFDYKQDAIIELIEMMRDEINSGEHGNDVVCVMEECLRSLIKSFIYVQRIDWYISGDDTKESMFENILTDFKLFYNDDIDIYKI